jgi:hypothetical protein
MSFAANARALYGGPRGTEGRRDGGDRVGAAYTDDVQGGQFLPRRSRIGRHDDIDRRRPDDHPHGHPALPRRAFRERTEPMAGQSGLLAIRNGCPAARVAAAWDEGVAVPPPFRGSQGHALRGNQSGARSSNC